MLIRSIKVFAVIMLALFSLSLSADPLSSRITAELADSLLAGKDHRRSETGKDSSVAWTPLHGLAALAARDLAAEGPDVVVEALYLWKRPKAVAPEDETRVVYNILRAVGSLQGIEYWSASRGKMRLFYEESWRVVSLEDRTLVSDAPVSVVPSLETLTVWQKDLSFGGNLNRFDYRSAADGVLMESTNLTRMSYGIVPVAAAGALKVRVLALIVDEGILFWVVSSARAAMIPGMRGKIEASFGNRAEAIFHWFSAKADEAWKGL